MNAECARLSGEGGTVSRIFSSWNTLSLAGAAGGEACICFRTRSVASVVSAQIRAADIWDGPGARCWSAHILEQCNKVNAPEHSQKLRQTVFRSASPSLTPLLAAFQVAQEQNLLICEANKPSLTCASLPSLFISSHIFFFFILSKVTQRSRKYLSCCYTIYVFNLTRKLVQLHGSFILFLQNFAFFYE